jgi:predicted kinase
MTLTPHEFIRRFLMHVLPQGFHRIRHYGLFANGHRAASIAKARELLAEAVEADCPPRTCRVPVRARRAHAHHRDLRTRLRAQVPAERETADGQDRHLMMTSAWRDHRNAALAPSW